MTTTVPAADGTPIHLSPTGEHALALLLERRRASFHTPRGGVRRDAEAIYLVGRWPSGIGGRSSVFPTQKQLSGAAGLVATSGGHPHTKPSDVLAPLLERCPPGAVADPFAGSGSTLLAARRMGRKVIGVELEERYCEVVAKRLAQHELFVS